MSKQRPAPPPDLCDQLRYPEAFLPAPELEEWLRSTFIESDSPLYNREHLHLQQATLGVLWTNVPHARQGMTVAGTASIPKPTQGDKWTKARLTYQLTLWFGDVPDFLITLDAPICAEANDTAFCALVEHELYHCGQARDDWGMPKFRKSDGKPVFTMRGHDVEEFVGIVERYGASGVLNPKVRELVDVGQRVPQVSADIIRGWCGTCLRV